ncbi:MAG: hypothetical protein AAB421_00880 [Patescibacteria group bacterium]
MDSEGGINPATILAGIIALAFFSPFAGEIVFKWVPATLSVVTGVEMDGDLRDIPAPLVVSVPLAPVLVAEEPGMFSGVMRQALLAQAAPAYDAAVGTGGITGDVTRAWSIFAPISIFVSLMLAVGILYSIFRIRQIRRDEKAIWNAGVTAGGESAVQEKTNARWQMIVEHVNTENPNDWRQAILEADIMLDELITAQGYHGDSMGDKMKQIERSDFNTIDLAWEAHKIRNRIAHEGSAHSLNSREARRVVSLYEQAFREFEII